MVIDGFWSKVEKLIGKDPFDKIKTILNGLDNRSKETPYINSKVRPLLAMFEEHEIDQGLLYERFARLITALKPIRKKMIFLISDEELKQLEDFYGKLNEKLGRYGSLKEKLDSLYSLNPIYKDNKKLRNFLIFNWDILQKMGDYDMEGRNYFIAEYPKLSDIINKREHLAVMFEITEAARQKGANTKIIIWQMIIIKKLIRNIDDWRKAGLLFAEHNMVPFDFIMHYHEDKIINSLDDVERFCILIEKMMVPFRGDWNWQVKEALFKIIDIIRPDFDELEFMVLCVSEGDDYYLQKDIVYLSGGLKVLQDILGKNDRKSIRTIIKSMGKRFSGHFIGSDIDKLHPFIRKSQSNLIFNPSYMASVFKEMFEYEELWHDKADLLRFIDIIDRSNIDFVFLMECLHNLKPIGIINNLDDLEEVAAFLEKHKLDIDYIKYALEKKLINNKQDLIKLDVIIKFAYFMMGHMSVDFENEIFPKIMELPLENVKRAFNMILSSKKGCVRRYALLIKSNFDELKRNPIRLEIYAEIISKIEDDGIVREIMDILKSYKAEIGDDNGKLKEILLMLMNYSAIAGKNFDKFNYLREPFYKNLDGLKYYGAPVAEFLGSLNETLDDYNAYEICKFIRSNKEKINTSDDMKQWLLVIADFINKAGLKNFFGLLVSIKDKINSLENLKEWGIIVVEIANKCKKEAIISVFKFIVSIKDKINTPEELKEWRLAVVEIANKSGKSVDDVFSEFGFVEFLVNQKKAGIKLTERYILTEFKKYMFGDLPEKFLDKIDSRMARTQHKDQVKELLKIASEKGRRGYKEWLFEENKERLENLRSLGVDIDLWLGNRRIGYKPVEVNLEVNENETLNKAVKNFGYWFKELFKHFSKPDIILKTLAEKLEKKPERVTVDNVISVLSTNPKLIDSFIGMLLKVVRKKQFDFNELNDEEFDEIKGFIAKRGGQMVASLPKERKQEFINELKQVKMFNSEQLNQFVGIYGLKDSLKGKIDEFNIRAPVAGHEADVGRILEELEQVRQSLSELKESGAIEKGNYMVSFRVSDKYPPEALTLGNDGGACTAMGGSNERYGYNFLQDSDAMFVEILSRRKKGWFSTFSRMGFALVFAAIDERNLPIIAMNTIEVPKSYASQVQQKLYDVTLDYLVEFAKATGFRKIVAGNGYGSNYFHKKYSTTGVFIRKLNPFPTKIGYYTNTFEKGEMKQTEKGIVLIYSGDGAVIWQS